MHSTDLKHSQRDDSMTRLCPHCFEESELKRRTEEIRPQASAGRCSFHPKYKGVPIEDVAQTIDEAFRANYVQGIVNSYSGDQPGDELPVLVHALTRAVDDDIIEAIAEQLIEDDDYWPPDGGEAFYADDQNYVEYEPDDYQQSRRWDAFCDSIVHSQRFFKKSQGTDRRPLRRSSVSARP